MKIAKSIAIAISISIGNCAYGQNYNQNNFLDQSLTCWKVVDHFHDDESAYTFQQLQNLSKRILCFKKDSAKLLIDDLINTQYFIEKVNAREYLWDKYQSDKKYFRVIADTLLKIVIKGIVISKKYNNRFPTEYELFYDNKYLFLFQDLTIFRLSKQKK